MAIVKPFKAVLPNINKASKIIVDTNISLSKKDIEDKLKVNPHSFLHVLHPNVNEDVNQKEHFKAVLNKYTDFKKEQILVKEAVPSFYLYETANNTNKYCGIIATNAVNDYKNDVIKKHEGTLRKRELLFEAYLKNLRFNPDPVLLSYPDNDEIDNIIKKYKQQKATYQFSTPNNDSHTIWIIDNEIDIKKITDTFHDIKTLYIADGHHRSTSSCLLADNLKQQHPNHTGSENYNFFMSYLLAESQLNIYEFNRFIKDLNGLSIEDFLSKLNVFFEIENKGKTLFKPKEKHQFSMYLQGDFYALKLRKSAYTFSDTLSNLDAQILYTTVLKPILGINDIRNESKITYSQNKSDGLELKTAVDSGKYSVSFGMVATTINELKEIVDAGLLMPPKTTYIEPKLKSGLAIYEF